MIRLHLELQESELLSDLAREAGFDIHCVQLEPGRLQGVVDFAGATDAQFFRERFGRAICIHGTVPKRMAAFTCPATPADSAVFCGEAVTSRTLGVIPAAGEYSYRAPAHHGILRTCFAAERLDRALRTLHHTSLAQVLPRTGHREISAAMMARMRLAMQSAFAPPLHPDLVLDDDAFDRAAEALLLDAICAALTFNTCPEVTRLAARNHWRCVRTALDYVEAHLSGALRMETLCLHTGVSERTLEAAFHEVTGLSPLHFIKLRRLNAARRVLKAAHRRETSIKAIALNCGFGHFGHFAHDYKAHFGERPSDTLARP